MFSSNVALRLLVCSSVIVMLAILPVHSDTRHCGASLTSAMDFICRGRFQTYDKRSGDNAVIDSKNNADIDDSYLNDNFQLHSRFARSPTTSLSWYIVKNDIIHSCCENPCGVEKMLSYCKRN